ncbi:zinc finger protein 497-like isoform X2 [Pan paniscus]|uniref:zinc finger protein 497-like isoform X2 n=1 Tax=Pan paniscus TaxID=9597 RepID=UPI00155F63FF|nr:zinc finger protein 497-like isoform X2 [Pan paniscus]
MAEAAAPPDWHCGLTSRERPRSDLQRSPFRLSWLLFRWWRRRWNPRLPGYRAWRDARGQPRRSWLTVRRWLWSSGTSWRQVGRAGDPAAGVRAAAEVAGERGEPAVQQELLDTAVAPGQQGGGPQGQATTKPDLAPVEKGDREATAACPVRRGARARALTQASWNIPRRSVLDQARGRGKWEEPAGPTGDHCGTPVLRDLSGPQKEEESGGPPSQAEPAARGTEQCPPCAQCGQSFGRKELSAPHQRVHRGPRPFAGAQCPKSFTQRTTPASHRRAHVAECTYTRAQCGKTFLQQSTLTPTTARTSGRSPTSASSSLAACPRCWSTGTRTRVSGPSSARNVAAASAACPRCWSTGTHTSARSPSSVRSATSVSRIWPT